MNSEPKQLWTTALRSDEYRQGKNTLTRIVNGKEFDCCLGVLCKIYAKTHSLKVQVRNDRFEYEDGSMSYLPDEVAEWAGIERSAEYVLSDKNDADVTFVDIADWIEENL